MTQWRPDFLELSPMLQVLEAGRRFAGASDFPDTNTLSQMAKDLHLKTASNLALHFVTAAAKPRGRARKRARQAGEPSYEQRIYDTGAVPTRSASWHDFFNALIWATFPATKAALNERQLLAGISDQVRSREQDRLAIFDEGGIVLAETSMARQYIAFGHALYESVLEPSLAVDPIYGMLLPVTVTSLDISCIDATLAKLIKDQIFAQNRKFDRYPLAAL